MKIFYRNLVSICKFNLFVIGYLKRIMRRFFKKRMRIRIAISTTASYIESTVPPLLTQMKRFGFQSDQVYIIEGGHEKNEAQVDYMGFRHYRVNHNSFDLTALISITELGIVKVNSNEYWLLLHDTVKTNILFPFLLYGIDCDDYECMPLRTGPSMNIGLYSSRFLVEHSTFLNDSKNTDYSDVGLQKAKHRAVAEEDCLFRLATHWMPINQILSRFEKSKQGDFFGAQRLVEYYPQLGLIKYKANYSSSNSYRVGI
jgi:hypothetical protein